ncbi:hypothetical protein P20652_1958 [Pseudoalteromonas sp. BSi20652]|uniref:DUF4303 domain-containing protein n=1 Tax=Pseudoalteromonas sp. BSi20652 TaxID=388384 RepID=UPI0002319BCA|nr:DUF4303 domain-containing protein [Pseudoalteromonas sp. BSi20652]GAA60094.1 hypothetical protein P20652_1958 [Pseudoalteromonas sp. BSi20652]
MLDTNNFEQVLYQNTKNAFKKVIQKYGNDLYVIGFYHTGNYSLLPMFNTLSNLKKVFEKEYNNDVSSFYMAKWNPENYPTLEDYSEYFDETTAECQKLENNLDSLQSDIEAMDNWYQWLATMEKVLKQLDSKGLFSNGLEREKITLAILAYDEEESIQFKRIKLLNPPAVLTQIQADFEAMIAERENCEQEALSAFS